ncbi:MAG: glutaredoxin family protein [Spirochaetales bacterium]|nr:glutaredoxin family protein [Spirochaetales bacterium]
MTAELYTTPTCGYCRKAKDYLRELGINVNEKDITKNPKYMEEFQKRVGASSGVPVIFLKGVKITGFDKKKIDAVLGI